VRRGPPGWPTDTLLLRKVARTLLEDLLGLKDYELEVALLSRPDIATVNGAFLRHAGPTDVIAFDYREPDRDRGLRGEVLICPEVARAQARRYRAAWGTELARYLVHGVLHLLGHDDRTPAARRAMKRQEDRLVRQLGRRFVLRRLAGSARVGV
jgi:probable rRNA maturation factor